jgi:transposase-like protein
VSLRSWIKQAVVGAGERRGGLWSDGREELACLRGEYQTWRMEREILKRPRPCFAEETDER